MHIPVSCHSQEIRSWQIFFNYCIIGESSKLELSSIALQCGSDWCVGGNYRIKCL